MKKFFGFLSVFLILFFTACSNGDGNVNIGNNGNSSGDTTAENSADNNVELDDDIVDPPYAEGNFSCETVDPDEYGKSYKFTIKNTGDVEITSWTLKIPILNSKYPNKYSDANGNEVVEETPKFWEGVSNATIERSGNKIIINCTNHIVAGEEDTSVAIWALLDSLDFKNVVLTLNGGSGQLFSERGKLSVDGTHLVDKNGSNIILRGISSFGINWDSGRPFINEAAFRNLRDEWGANAVRLAMYTYDYYGYGDMGDCKHKTQEEVREELKGVVERGVKYATDLGMYVMIDWHVLHDKNPLTYKNEAKEFFGYMAQKFASQDNVIYEICNEPNNCSWDDIKSYAAEVIPVIRQYSPDAIIVCGTPSWDQDVDIAADSPLTGTNAHNVMYSVHFYSGTHKDDIRSKVQTALVKKLPVFCTEYGITIYDGGGNEDRNIYTEEAEKWLDFFDKNGISYFCWSFSNQDESSALIKASCKKTSGWTSEERSDAGNWIVKQYNERNGK